MKKTSLMYKKLMRTARGATGATMLALALASASVSQAAYLPIPFSATNYNADVIVESNATPVLKVVTTATVDAGSNNTANTWFEIGYDTLNLGNGLPAAGSTFTASSNPNYSFTMAPTYSAPNGILIDTVVTNGTWTLTTPATYRVLSFLGSGGNGGDVIGVKVNHQDGTFETSAFPCPDWFGGTSNVAYTAGGRCQSPTAFSTETDGLNPRLYFRDMTLANTTSPVTSVVLSYVSGGANSHNALLAMSGATTPGGAVGPISVTGYTYDFIVEASAGKRGQLTSQVIVDGTNQWATTQSLDTVANTGDSFYEKGYNINNFAGSPHPSPTDNETGTGLPHAGTLVTNGAADHVYQLAPSYTTNDAVWLSSTTITNASIVFNSPTNIVGLSLLGAGAGAVNILVVAHHQDTTLETNLVTIPDWFDNSAPYVIATGGRVAVDTGVFDVRNDANGDPRVFSCDTLFLADQGSAIVSIDLINTNAGGQVAIFGVSGGAGSVPPIFTQQPVGTNALAGTPISFTAQVAGVGPFTYQWQKGTNGTFATLNNGGNVSGATTTTLVINPADYFADAADYRLIATTAGGSATSAVVTASLVSTLTDVTQPGDPITFFGGNLFGDGPVAQAIDNTLNAKWGANPNTTPLAIGCVVRPNAGATLITGARFYTANDTTGRDPADYKLEGSTDNGVSYTLIASNRMTLPDGRNSAGAPDPLNSFVKEVSFPNTNGYTSYRLTFSHLKGGDSFGSFQLGEFELLGVTTNLPLLVSAPATAKAYDGGQVTITANVTGSPAPNSRWQKQVGAAFTDLHDGGTISGSQTAALTINPAVFSDAGNYRIIATNTLAAATSSVVVVSIFDTNVDIVTPGDPTTDTGNNSDTPAQPIWAFDNSFTAFTSRGSGANNNAGFPPFGGPVGVIVTPTVGATVVTALRVYTGPDGAVSDPADIQLDGSNDAGSNYTTILPETALSLPDDRNTALFDPIDPLQKAVQEIRFANSQAYTTYRLTFQHVKDDNSTYFISIGEMELLGVPGTVTIQPTISSAVRVGGNLEISGSGGTPNGSFSVLTNADVTLPVATWGTNVTGTFDGGGNFSASLPISASNPRLFYLIKTP